MELKPSPGFLPRLESLRGVAAVSVVGYHVAAIYWDIIATGMIAVVMFFVLSGFVLARSLQQNSSPAAFFRSRFFRLFPPAAATVLLLAALYWLFGFWVGFRGEFDLFNVLLNALMIKSDINGVMWSMTVECAATPVILGSFWALGVFGPTPLIIACLILFGLSFWGPYVHLLGSFTNLAPLYGFVIGVLVCCRRQDFLQRMSPRVVYVLTACAIALMFFCGAKKQTAPVILLEVPFASDRHIGRNRAILRCADGLPSKSVPASQTCIRHKRSPSKGPSALLCDELAFQMTRGRAAQEKSGVPEVRHARRKD
jgi:exopolysaccharide production protein ExoZ